MHCSVLLCIGLYYCILVRINVFSVYYYVLFVFLCIVLYSSVLLFIASGKLTVYDCVAGKGITNHMGAPDWSNQTYLTL